jgi:DNA polymerase III alpha subunit (gram-positive type)
MDLVIFDLETTGLSPYSEEIIQIAAVKMSGGRILEESAFSTYVDPGRRISSFITSYTGITNDQVRNAPPPAEALTAFSEFAGSGMLIAHNGRRFDLPFIRESCSRHGLSTREVGFVDSMAFSRKLWGGRGGHGLDAVMQRLQLRGDGVRRHDARGDVAILAEAVRRMWAALTPDFQSCPVPCGSGLLADGMRR